MEVVLKWLGEEQLSDDEIAKLNLLSALHNAYLQHKKNGGFKEFVLSVLEFYGELTPVESSFLISYLQKTSLLVN